MHDIIASLIGVTIAELVTSPISCIKTVYQSNINHLSIKDATKYIYTKHGIVGFFNATLVGTITQVSSTTVKYTIYQYLKKYNNPKNDLGLNILNNVISNILVGVCGHPLDVLIINQQNQSLKFLNFKTCDKKFWFNGLKLTLTKSILGGAVYFPVYDYFLKKNNNPILSGVITSIIGTIILHPIDLYKTRQIALVEQVYIKNIFRGLAINLCRIVPHFTIMVTVIEKLKFKQNNSK